MEFATQVMLIVMPTYCGTTQICRHGITGKGQMERRGTHWIRSMSVSTKTKTGVV